MNPEKTIKQILAENEDFQHCKPYDINNGLCEEFASAIQQKLPFPKSKLIWDLDLEVGHSFVCIRKYV